MLAHLGLCTGSPIARQHTLNPQKAILATLARVGAARHMRGRTVRTRRTSPPPEAPPCGEPPRLWSDDGHVPAKKPRNSTALPGTRIWPTASVLASRATRCAGSRGADITQAAGATLSLEPALSRVMGARASLKDFVKLVQLPTHPARVAIGFARRFEPPDIMRSLC